MNRRRPRSIIKLNPVPVQDFPYRFNLTRKDMAGRAGISGAYCSQLLNGDRCASARVRSRFQPVMGVDDFDLLFIPAVHRGGGHRLTGTAFLPR